MIALLIAGGAGLVAGVLLGFRWGLRHAISCTVDLYGQEAGERVLAESKR